MSKKTIRRKINVLMWAGAMERDMREPSEHDYVGECPQHGARHRGNCDVMDSDEYGTVYACAECGQTVDECEPREWPAEADDYESSPAARRNSGREA